MLDFFHQKGKFHFLKKKGILHDPSKIKSFTQARKEDWRSINWNV